MKKAQLCTTAQEGDATVLIVVVQFGPKKYLNGIVHTLDDKTCIK